MAPDSLEVDKCHTDMPSIQSTKSIILDLPPSCLEFAPPNPDYFVVGTYELEQNPKASQDEVEQALLGVQNRRGSLVLFSLREDLVLHQTLDVPYAILDLHFKSFKQQGVFAIATSKGAVCLCSLDTRREIPIESSRSFQIFDQSLLTLSLAWCPIPHFHGTIAASCSNGEITAFDSGQEFSQTCNTIEPHSLEAWTVAWTEDEKPGASPGIVCSELYSGGDDSVLSRHNTDLGDTAKGFCPNFGASVMDRKTHTAGVTAILPLKADDGGDLVLTGSYDEWVRLLLSTQGRSKILAEERLYGGIWRLKLIHSKETNSDSGICFEILASCMHAGARIIKVQRSNNGDWSINVLAKFVEHESMNYASDARSIMTDNKVIGHTFVSTSFYDKKLCVWKLEDQ